MNAQEITNLVNKYKKSDSKVLFFENLNDNEKVVLYSKLEAKDKKELISSLPYRPIKKLFEASKKDGKKEILKLLSRSQLRDIYTYSSVNKQQEIQKLINEVQIGLSESQSSYMSNIVTNSNSRNTSYNNIASNTDSISQNKMDLKDKKKELKTQNKVIKKTSKERERALNKLLKAENNLHKRSNRIAVISNYRMNKYNEKLNTLQEKDTQLSNERNTKMGIEKDIDNIHKEINDARKEIKEEREKIKKYNSEISENTKALGENQAEIKKLSQEEKRMLGRKLYNKKVSQRDRIFVRKKQRSLEEQGEILDATYTNPVRPEDTINSFQSLGEEIEQTSAVTNASGEEQPTQTEAPQSSTNEKSSLDVKTIVEQISELIKMFNEMGITFNNDQNMVNIYQGGDIKYNVPIASLTEDKNVILSMATLYSLQMQDSLEESQGRSRGSINIGIVVAFIILILGVILFVMN